MNYFRNFIFLFLLSFFTQSLRSSADAVENNDETEMYEMTKSLIREQYQLVLEKIEGTGKIDLIEFHNQMIPLIRDLWKQKQQEHPVNFLLSIEQALKKDFENNLDCFTTFQKFFGRIEQLSYEDKNALYTSCSEEAIELVLFINLAITKTLKEYADKGAAEISASSLLKEYVLKSEFCKMKEKIEKIIAPTIAFVSIVGSTIVAVMGSEKLHKLVLGSDQKTKQLKEELANIESELAQVLVSEKAFIDTLPRGLLQISGLVDVNVNFLMSKDKEYAKMLLAQKEELQKKRTELLKQLQPYFGQLNKIEISTLLITGSITSIIGFFVHKFFPRY